MKTCNHNQLRVGDIFKYAHWTLELLALDYPVNGQNFHRGFLCQMHNSKDLIDIGKCDVFGLNGFPIEMIRSVTSVEFAKDLEDICNEE